MLRKFVSAAVILVLVAGVSLGQKAAKGKKGHRGHRGTVTKVDGNKVTVSHKAKGGTATDKTYTISDDTKFMAGRKDLSKTEAMGMLKAGARVSVAADENGNVKVLRFGKGGKGGKKKPK
jgi:hypothetical protein